MHVVVGVVELARLAHAGAAGAGVEKADVQGAAEDAGRASAARSLGLVRIGGPFVAGSQSMPAPSPRPGGSGNNGRSGRSRRRRRRSCSQSPRSGSAARLSASRPVGDAGRDRGGRARRPARSPVAPDSGSLLIPVRRPLRTQFAMRALLSIALGVRQPEAREDDREVLEGEVLGREVKAVPVGERRRRDPPARDRAVLAQAQPMERRAERAPRPRRAPPRRQSSSIGADRPRGQPRAISRMIAADCPASRNRTRRRA